MFAELVDYSMFDFLFLGLGAYPLIDVDETRYAVMARDLIHSEDWNSLMLNEFLSWKTTFVFFACWWFSKIIRRV